MNKRTIILIALVVLSMVGAASANEATGYENPSLDIDGDGYMILAEAQDHDIVSIADITLQPGATTTVPIQLLNSTGVGGIAVTLTFDPLIVNVTTGVVGNFNDNFNLDFSNISDGVMRVTCTKSGPDLIGDLTIATITLEAVGASGSCELGLSAELSNKTGGNVTPTTNNGTFTISTQYDSADTNQNCVVDLTELMAQIGRWKIGTIGLTEMMTSIGRWKVGSGGYC